MRVAALYDIHGNLPALAAVLAEVRATGVDHIVIGGDVIPGPMPRECLDRLATLDVPASCIIGNGDRETVTARGGQVSATIPEYFKESIRWNAAQLGDEDERTIRAWPLTRAMTIDGVGKVVFCHASPRNDLDIFTAATPDGPLQPLFDPLNADLVVCGHTHMQFDRTIGTTRIVNAGSVGMSFEGVGAYWLLIDQRVELRRTDYDLAAAAERVRRTAYPLADEFAAKNILTTPAREMMLAAFAAAELKRPAE